MTNPAIIDAIKKEIVNKNIEYDEAVIILHQVAQKFNQDKDEFVNNYVGLIDNNMKSSLCLDDNYKQELKNLCNIRKYDKYYEKSYIFQFDFSIGRILPVLVYRTFKYEHKILKLFRHFENIMYTYKHKLALNPSRTSYMELTRKYNMSINYINQHFNKLIKLPYCVEPLTNTYKPKSFKSGLYYEPLLGIDYDDTELSEWKKTFIELEKENSISWIKEHNPNLYNKMIKFHIKEKIVVHGSKCCWLKNDLANVAKAINSFLSDTKYNGGIITNENIDIYKKNFVKYTNFGKKKCNNFDENIIVGDVSIRCICIKSNYEQCNTLFNISHTETFEVFKLKFKDYKYNNTFDEGGGFIQDPVEYMFERLDTLLDPSKRPNNRLNSSCPKCNHINQNDEAILNNKGYNPILKHPSDIICDNCHHAYCTDCSLSHPGFICRGFPEENDTAKDIESCPACGHITERTGGCTCMTCVIPTCRRTWCWFCRCLRHPEQNVNNINPDLLHYCMDEYRYISNHDWVNNPDFKPYKVVAPLGSDDMDFVPA